MDTILTRLEAKVSELLSTCQRLRQDNAGMRAQQSSLLSEYETLKQKHDQAVKGVASMIDRLKKAEQLL